MPRKHSQIVYDDVSGQWIVKTFETAKEITGYIVVYPHKQYKKFASLLDAVNYAGSYEEAAVYEISRTPHPRHKDEYETASERLI